MPIIIDPAYVAPAPPTTVTGADNILSARADDEHSGALLRADFTALPELPERVRFLRADGSPVRSGDPAFAPGGIAVAYDHEAPLGQPTSWTAVPILADGTEGAPSLGAALTLPEPTGSEQDVWLKSVLQPELSVRLWLRDPPKMGRAGRLSSQRVAGRRNHAASWDVRDGYATTFSVATSTVDERRALEALLDAGPLLFQSTAEVDVDDFYLLPGDVEWQWAGDAHDPLRLWTIPVVEVDRPATIDAPLQIPGLSWETVVDDYASWDAVEAQVPTWLDLLGW